MENSTPLTVEADRAIILSPNSAIAEILRTTLQNNHWQIDLCQNEAEFVRLADKHSWSLVLVAASDKPDLPQAVLQTMQSQLQLEQTVAVVIAEHPSADEAMHCAQLGATIYLSWPILPTELLAIAQRARKLATISEAAPANANGCHTSALPNVPNVKEGKATKHLIGASRSMLELAQQLVKVAQSPDLPVFINGETGTGKEVVAWQLHFLSHRPGAFRAINCAAMVESLLESELFGHEKGAFTGAHTMKRGLWEEATNGTIFLDEVTEATPAIQAKLLRVLQEGTIRRVGSNQEIRVTARVIAASNREIDKAVRKGHFRKDLFYRLGQVLRIPPLRERVEDIPLLVSHFCQRTGKEIEIAPEAMELLCAYEWPGNVRELECLINKLATFFGCRIFAEDVQQQLQIAAHRIGNPVNLPLLSMINAKLPRQWPTAQQVRDGYVIEAYHYFGRESQVARALGMDYRTVSGIIREYQQRHAPPE